MGGERGVVRRRERGKPERMLCTASYYNNGMAAIWGITEEQEGEDVRTRLLKSRSCPGLFRGVLSGRGRRSASGTCPESIRPRIFRGAVGSSPA
eukprot:3474692-Prymnesium_polylepis.1